MDPAKAWMTVVDFLRSDRCCHLQYGIDTGLWTIRICGSEWACLGSETLVGLAYEIEKHKQATIKPADIPPPKKDPDSPEILMAKLDAKTDKEFDLADKLSAACLAMDIASLAIDSTILFYEQQGGGNTRAWNNAERKLHSVVKKLRRSREVLA